MTFNFTGSKTIPEECNSRIDIFDLNRFRQLTRFWSITTKAGQVEGVKFDRLSSVQQCEMKQTQIKRREAQKKTGKRKSKR